MRKSKFGSSRTRLLILGCAIAALAQLAAPTWSAAVELPPPIPSYPYYEIPSVTVEVHGAYSESYTDALGDEEEADLHFVLSRAYSEVEWWASTSPPTVTSQLGFGMDPGPDHLEASGTFQYFDSQEGLAEPTVTCDYSQRESEPPSAEGAGPFAGLIEMMPNVESAGAMSVEFHYPLAGDLIASTPAGPEDELCADHAGVGTSGDPSKESGYLLALSPLDFYSVNTTSGAAEQTFKFPHSYSGTVEGDQVDLSDEVVVKLNRLPPLLPPFGPYGPPEEHGPSTPITPPTVPPKPPVIQEPEVEGNPPVVTGGGGPPKLRTGIKAKCPKAGKPCTVMGVVEAELPAPRPARKADASRKAKIQRVVLGRVSFALAAGASKTVVITLSKAGVVFLRSHPGVRAKIAVTVTAPGAAKASRTRTAKLRLPRHRHR